MMDSKQLALIYLMEESNKMASVCTRNVHNLDAKKATAEIQKQLGKLFSSMREVAEEFKVDENIVQEHAEKEYEERAKNR